MIKTITKFFDQLEDAIRQRLSRRPIVYAFIAGLAIVLFWRGVWTLADLFAFMTPGVSLIVSIGLMLLTGTFVSFFIGERLIFSGLKKEKRSDQKTEEEFSQEEASRKIILTEIQEMKKEILAIKSMVEKNTKPGQLR